MSMVSIKRLILGLFLAVLIAFGIYGVILLKAQQAKQAFEKPLIKTSRNSPLKTQQPYRLLPTTITSKPLIQALIAQDQGRIQLLNFFSYGCYGCMRWHPFLEQWLKAHASEVKAYAIPILFHKEWEPLAHAYYIAKTLKRNDLDSRFFKAIHTDHLLLSNQTELADFFAKQGVPETTFNELYQSFSISQSLLQAKNITMAYEVTLSPTLILNTPQGSYAITPNTIPEGDGHALLKVLDDLLINKKINNG